jgi:hypothetical protein
LELGCKFSEARISTKLRVDSTVVTDVVTMSSAGPRGQNRRRIKISNAELFEIRNNRRSVAHRELPIQLQAVS